MARSYSLVDGFLNAFDTWNLMVAAPILRMQIDNLVRVYYIANEDDGQITKDLLGGKEFRHMTDSEGKKLTDSRLTELAEVDHSWIRTVYEVTSGWVHFSPEHLRAALDVHEHEDGTMSISGSVPIPPKKISPSSLEQLIIAMHQANGELSAYMDHWREQKKPASKPADQSSPDGAHPSDTRRDENRRLAGGSAEPSQTRMVERAGRAQVPCLSVWCTPR